MDDATDAIRDELNLPKEILPQVHQLPIADLLLFSKYHQIYLDY